MGVFVCCHVAAAVANAAGLTLLCDGCVRHSVDVVCCMGLELDVYAAT